MDGWAQLPGLGLGGSACTQFMQVHFVVCIQVKLCIYAFCITASFACTNRREQLRRKEEPSTETMIMWPNVRAQPLCVETAQPDEVSAKPL